MNSLHQNSTNSEKNCVPQFVSSVSTDKVSLDENSDSLGSVEKVIILFFKVFFNTLKR